MEKLFPFIVVLIKKREAAIKEASNHYDLLIREIKENSNKVNLDFSHEDDLTNENIILNEPIKYFDNIFISANYKNFVKYAFIVKRYQGKIDNFVKIAVCIILALVGLLYLLTKSIVAVVIVFIILLVALLLAAHFLIKGKSYSEFYKEKVYDLIFKILPGYSVSYGGVNINMNNDILSELIKISFDRYKTSDHLVFQSDKINGELFNLVIEKDYESKDKDGNVNVNTKDVFDGFSITLNYQNSFNFLKGAIIQIRDDDNAFSALTEDTAQSIYQKNKEFMFNSEELNKSFDCFIEGTNSFGDIDALMEKIHMVITPMFEEQLLFLKKRYNTFNMTITDTMINFNVNMHKSQYQKLKSKEMFSLKTKYRDYIKVFKLPIPGSAKANDFMLYKMFPSAEKLFYVLYFDTIMHTYLNRDSMKVENFDLIKSFQTRDLEIAEMIYSEFKNKYKIEIENVYEESKKIEINLGKEEYNGKNI